MKRNTLPYLPSDLKKPSGRPPSGANEILNVAETTKETSRGRAHLFKVNGTPVAYYIGTVGYITKDPLTQKQIRVIHNFFARNHVSYNGKIPQSDIDSL